MKPLFFSVLLILATISQAQNDTSLSTTPTQPFITVQQMPHFPGGKDSMNKFLINTVDYPEAAVTRKIEGVVRLKFVVQPNGDITDIVVTSKKYGYGLEEEAIRVIMKMPRWIPGKQNGVTVPVYYNLPIGFRLF